jgi:hypothetical protein
MPVNTRVGDGSFDGPTAHEGTDAHRACLGDCFFDGDGFSAPTDNDLSSASMVGSKPPIRQTGNEEWAQFREEWLKDIERLQLLAIGPSLFATRCCTRI